MLFNSPVFIFLFLPATLLVFSVLRGRGHHESALSFLVAASIFFYGWWDPPSVFLLGTSVLVNYVLGRLLSHSAESRRPWLLTLGVVFNLGLLGYYKYAGFFVSNLNAASGTDFGVPQIVLPLAISFFTFQQIAYLVDASRGKAREYAFRRYVLFVTFFPQLIAGPIVHHAEMMPQFDGERFRRRHNSDLAIGVTIFVIGLFKKVVIADEVARYASQVFASADLGMPVGFFAAWEGALAYTVQIYFDFSGYSDMAIGIARMFGIRLPLNFDSPYQATGAIEFWRRWHMTLSRFLRDYLYFPLGGNRHGSVRRYVNLATVMLLGGLWHGAGWNFVIWGGLHGAYLCVNHGWRYVRERLVWLPRPSPWTRAGGQALTLAAVVFAWVFFRAETIGGALEVVRGMFGLSGFEVSQAWRGTFESWGLPIYDSVAHRSVFRFSGLRLAVLLLAFALLAPNTQQYLSHYDPCIGRPRPTWHGWRRLLWRPTYPHSLWIAVLALVSLLSLWRISEFLYFQF